MSVKLLAEHNLEFLSFKGGWSEYTLVIIQNEPHCWKSHITAQIIMSKLSCLFFSGYVVDVTAGET